MVGLVGREKPRHQKLRIKRSLGPIPFKNSGQGEMGSSVDTGYNTKDRKR